MPAVATRRTMLVALVAGLGMLGLTGCGQVTATGGGATTPVAPTPTTVVARSLGGSQTSAPAGTASNQAASPPGGGTPTAPASNAAKGSTTVHILSWAAADAPTRANWESYAQSQPGIKIDATALPAMSGITADDKFLVTVSAGAPPDLYWTGSASVPDWAIKDILMPLDSHIASSTAIRRDNFMRRALEEGSWRGKTYGLYWSADARRLYWNKDLFAAAGLDPEQPPETWDTFLAAMQKLTKTNPDGSIQQLGYHPLYDSVGASFWEAWFWELGGSFLSADSTKVTVADAAGYGALDWLVKQAEAQGGWAQITSYFTAASKSAASTSFLGWGFGLQKVAMEIEVGNVVTNIKAHWPDIHYGAADVPAAADGTRASVRGGYSWVAPTRAAQPDAAWSFLEWVFGIGPMTTFCNARDSIPTTLEAQQSAKWLPGDPAGRKLSAEVVAYSQRVPCIAPGTNQLHTASNSIPGPVLEGKMTPQAALTTAQTQMQAILTQALNG